MSPGEAANGSRTQAPPTNADDQTPWQGSWIWPSLASPVGAIWGINQQMGGSTLLLSLSAYQVTGFFGFSVLFFKEKQVFPRPLSLAPSQDSQSSRNQKQSLSNSFSSEIWLKLLLVALIHSRAWRFTFVTAGILVHWITGGCLDCCGLLHSMLTMQSAIFPKSKLSWNLKTNKQRKTN